MSQRILGSTGCASGSSDPAECNQFPLRSPPWAPSVHHQHPPGHASGWYWAIFGPGVPWGALLLPSEPTLLQSCCSCCRRSEDHVRTDVLCSQVRCDHLAGWQVALPFFVGVSMVLGNREQQPVGLSICSFCCCFAALKSEDGVLLGSCSQSQCCSK